MGKINIMGEEFDYKPYVDEMYMHKLRTRLMRDPSFKIVFQVDLTNDFIKTLQRIIDPTRLHEENIILSLSGETGGGKSATMMSLCKSVLPERFSYKNVCFFDSQILELAKELPRDSIIIRDEGVDKAIYGVGSQRTSGQLQVLVETCRKAGISIIFIEPEFKENLLTKYYFEVVDRDINNRITRVAVMDKYTKSYLGAIYVKVFADDHPDWIEYNNMKDKFISDMREGKLTDAKVDYKGMAKDIYTKINIDIFRTKKDRLAFIRTEHPNFTNSENEMISTFLEVLIKHGFDSIEEE